MYDLLKQLILDPIHQLANTLSGGDSMAKGLITVAILGLLAATARNVPARIYRNIRKRLVVTVEIQDADASKKLFRHVSDFISQKTSFKNFTIEASNVKKVLLQHGVGLGRGWFILNRKIFFYNRYEKKLGSDKDAQLVPCLVISTFGQSSKAFQEIYGKHFAAFEPSEKLYFKTYDSSSYAKADRRWQPVGVKKNAPYLAVNKDVKKQIDDAVTFFLENKDWYHRRGIAYKLSFVLYGPPGTGKTALTRYISDITARHLSSVGVGSMTGSEFVGVFRDASGRDLVLSFQDFEVNPGFWKRDDEEKKEEETTVVYSATGARRVPLGIPLDTILNTLQGDVPLDDVISVFTTNHIERVDPAFLRKGRTDVLIEVGPLHLPEVKDFWEFYYETQDPLPESFKHIEILAANLMAVFQENAFSKQGFLQALTKYVNVPVLIETEETKKLLETV